MSEPATLTVPEATAYLRVGKTTLYKLFRTRRLRKVKILGATRVRRADLDRLLTYGVRA